MPRARIPGEAVWVLFGREDDVTLLPRALRCVDDLSDWFASIFAFRCLITGSSPCPGRQAVRPHQCTCEGRSGGDDRLRRAEADFAGICPLLALAATFSHESFRARYVEGCLLSGVEP